MRKTPKVLGILSVIFGALTAPAKFFSLFITALTMTRLASIQATPPSSNLIQMQRAIFPYAFPLQSFYAILAAALIVIGIGLIQQVRWSRRAAIIWALLAVCYVAAEIIIQVAVVMPLVVTDMQPTFGVMEMGEKNNVLAAVSIIGPIFTALFNLPFPIILLALLGRKSAVHDFK